MQHLNIQTRWKAAYSYPVPGQSGQLSKKRQRLGRHWKCGNYAWQKTINRRAFQPLAAAVSCRVVEGRRRRRSLMPKWWRGREGKGAVLSRGEYHFTDQSPVVVVPCKHSVNSILALVLEPIVTNHNPGNSQLSLIWTFWHFFTI